MVSANGEERNQLLFKKLNSKIMKRLKLFYFLLALIGIFISCNKESHNEDVSNEIYNSDIHLRNQTQYFQDTTGWEQWYVFNLMKEMPDDELLNFLKHQGYPDWDNYVRKTGSQLSITSIPIMYGDSLNGVIRVYVTNEDTIRVNYFSKAIVDDAISRELDTEEYHLIRGAVQSIMSLTCQIHGVSNGVYQNWLLSQRNRIQERTVWDCIEIWDCYWDYPCWNGASGGGGMQEICDLVYRECWKDFPNFNFPNGNNGTGGNNNNGSNNNPNTTGGGTHGDAANIFQIKSTTLSTWMDANDVPDEFFNLLYGCVIYLPSPLGGAAENFVNERCVNEVWEEQHNEGWNTRPLDADRIWEMADTVKSRLIGRYPNKAALIRQLFPCRVLGPALENAVLESLGTNNFASTNSNYLLPGLSRRPDGYHKDIIIGASPAGYLHTFTEVKGVFSTAQNPVFNYSNQMGQFMDYITWLSNNQYQGIGPNAFYLVLPAGVAIDQSLITTASNANIQFIVSGLEQSLSNHEEIRVSKPVHKNIYQTILNPNLLCQWCARLFPINGLYGFFG